MKYYMEHPGAWSKEMWSMEKVVPAVWVAVEMATGKLGHDRREFGDDLKELDGGWEWKRFLLIPESNTTLSIKHPALLAGGRGDDD